MAYDRRLETSEDGLAEIYIALQRFNPDIFIYAAKYGDVDKDRLILMTQHIAEYRAKLENEYRFLTVFGEKFNMIYATNNNQRFTIVNGMLNRMKCGIKMTKDLYSLFCPKQNRYAARLYELYGKTAPIWNHSFISTTTYSNDLFGIESYSNEIQGCYTEMKKFFALLQKCIEYCQNKIKQEREIRQDPDFVDYLYKKQVMELMDSVTDFLVGVKELDEEFFNDNPLLEGRKKYGDTKRNLQVNYHNCTPAHVRQAMTYDLYHNEELKNIPLKVRKLFKNDIKMIRLAYRVVENFDSFVIGKKEGQSVGKEIVAMFVFWCGTGDVKNTVEFLKDNYHGQYRIVGSTDVYTEYNKLKDEEAQSHILCNLQYHNFTKKIEELNPVITTPKNDAANPKYIIKMPQMQVGVNV